MTMDPYNLTLILLVTLVTFAMRAVGAVVMARVELGPVSSAAFEAMPVAVLTAFIAPAVLTQGLPEAVAGTAAVLVGIAEDISSMAPDRSRESSIPEIDIQSKDSSVAGEYTNDTF
ncbi:MAG: AzlD domain-containing protein, partial [Pseudomonadota bacterium]